MQGQTICKYGDVTLYQCLIQRIEQRPVFEASGTDLKCWQFTVKLTGYLHGWPAACRRHSVTEGVTDVTTLDDSTADSHKQVRWRLAPRQTFALAVGCTTTIASGNTLLYAEPMVGAIAIPPHLSVPRGDGSVGLTRFDVNDGPRCLQFDVAHVAADNIYKVEAVFEIFRVQCTDDDEAGGNQTGVLSHRWSSADMLDHNLRTTRLYRGTLEVASAVLNPHWFRYLVVPPLLSGFRRDKLEFTATEDGKKLQYSITDQEVAVSAPPPARKWSVQHTEIALKNDSAKSHGSCTVTLEGDSKVDKMQLISLGLSVITAKLLNEKFGAIAAGVNAALGDITITDNTGDVNSITVSATVQRPLKAAGGMIVPHVPGFQKQIELADLPAFVAHYNPRLSMGAYVGDPVELNGPIPLIGIFSAFLQTPCDEVHAINGDANALGVDFNVPGIKGDDVTIDAIIVSDLGETDVDFYSASQLDHLYTFYQCEGIFQTKSMRSAMPIASTYSGTGLDTSPGTQVISLSRPQTRYVLRISAERLGQWPEFPDPEQVGTNSPALPQLATIGGAIPAIAMKMLTSRLLGGAKAKTATGDDIYRAQFEAVYALLRAPTATEILKFGHNKWSTDNGGTGTVSNPILTNSEFV